MRKPKKRNINPARIRKNRPYTTSELSQLLNLHPNTIRQWAKDGLNPLDSAWPIMFHGSDIKDFIRSKRQVRKQICAPDEMFCFKCKKPVRPYKGKIDITIVNQKLVQISGHCEACETKIFRRANINNLCKMLELQSTITLHNLHLLERIPPILKRYIEPPPLTQHFQPSFFDGEGVEKSSVGSKLKSGVIAQN